MTEPEWLRGDAVVALQAWLIAELGGAPGIRDDGLLDSALFRPQHRFAYEASTLFDLAACYAFGLIRNHRSSTGTSACAAGGADVFALNRLRFVGIPTTRRPKLRARRRQ
jgi:death-on-curing protein